MTAKRKFFPRAALYLLWVAFLFALVLVLLGAVALRKSGMYWHDEENVLSSAAAWVTHQPLYPSAQAPQVYGLLYGPVAFLVYALPLRIAPDSLILLRALVLAGVLTAFFFLYRCARLSLPAWLSLGLTGCAACYIYTEAVIFLGFRADLWLLIAFSIATYAAVRRLPVLCALALAAGVDIKANMAIAAVATLFLLGARVSRRTLLWAGMLTAAAAISVFLLPGISLLNYAATLRMAARHGFKASLFGYNLLYLAVLGLLPAASGFMAWVSSPHALLELLRKYRVALGLYLLAAAAGVMTGAKNGSGEWQLWPLIPAIIAGSAKMLQIGLEDSSDGKSPSRERLARQLWFAALLLTVLYAARFSRRTIHWVLDLPPERTGLAVIGTQHTIRGAYPGRNLVVGPGRNGDELPYIYNYVAIAEGNPDLVDENAVAEDNLGGVPLRADSLQLWQACGNRIWLFPAGDKPFITHDSYADLGGKPFLFPESLTRNFESTHHLVQHTRYYDVWTCI